MDSLTVTLKDVAQPTEGQVVRVEVKYELMAIFAEGYGSSHGINGCVAAIEKMDGKLSLLVFADSDQAKPTHIINLEGAKL
ncbi:MAG: hypothetical protein IH810_05865 [Proteobacteria bacterium]|nr:hypothetical protein [Pseudomonadota bacterium]